MRPSWQLEGPQVTLEQVLDGREARAQEQARWLARPGTLVCLTLNMPGPVKRFPLADAAFWEGARLLLWQMEGAGFKLLEQTTVERPGGMEFYLRVEGDAADVKRRTLQLEERPYLGRLLDVDVFRRDGSKVSRREWGLGPRLCLLCPRPAAECARSRAHGIEGAVQAAIERMGAYFDDKKACWAAGQACRALLHEVCCTPKPGLVDGRNSGAHRDMDQVTFLDSTVALSPYFEAATREGLCWEGAVGELLPRLRAPGLEAEAAMKRATGGVNTHKGAIFSLGILCAAAGTLWRQGTPVAVETLLRRAGAIAAPALEDFKRAMPPTAGRSLRKNSGVQGIRGEAAAGFPAVSRWGLPALQRGVERGFSWNGACCAALCALLAHVQDTNLLHRGGEEGLAFVHRQAGAIGVENEEEQMLLRRLAQLDDELIRRNLSPGGCADLLAATLLVYFFTTQDSSFFDIGPTL